MKEEDFERDMGEPIDPADITGRQFVAMAKAAILGGWIHYCAPYWYGEKKMFMVKSVVAETRRLLTREQAAFYLIGLLDAVPNAEKGESIGLFDHLDDEGYPL